MVLAVSSLAGFAQGHELPPEKARALSAFNEWSQRFVAGNPEERAAAEPRGLELAQERRAVMRELIEADPRAALENAVPHGVRRHLPARVAELLEERVGGRGTYGVLGTITPPGEPASHAPISRTVQIGGKV